MTDYCISNITTVYHVSATLFVISGNVSGIQGLFLRLGLVILRKHLTGDYRKMFMRDDFVLYV